MSAGDTRLVYLRPCGDAVLPGLGGRDRCRNDSFHATVHSRTKPIGQASATDTTRTDWWLRQFGSASGPADRSHTGRDQALQFRQVNFAVIRHKMANVTEMPL